MMTSDAAGNGRHAIKPGAKAREMFEGKLQRLCRIFLHRGKVLNLVSEWDEAIDFLQKGLGLSRFLKSQLIRCQLSNLLGWVYIKRGNWHEAKSLFQYVLDTLAGSVDEGNRQVYSDALNEMGLLYFSKGEYDRAMDFFDLRLTICTETNDRKGYVITIGNMGLIYMDRGQYDRAIRCFDRQLAFSQEAGDKNTYINAINNMGIIHTERGEYEKAKECFEKGLEISEEIGDKAGISQNIGNLGLLYTNTGHFERAMKCHQRAWHICQEHGDQAGVAIHDNNLGLLHMTNGAYDEALKCFTKSRDISRVIDDKIGDGLANGNIGCVYQIKKEYRQALVHLEMGIAVLREVGEKYNLSQFLLTQAEIHYALAHYHSASKIKDDAYQMASSIDRKDILFQIKVLAAKLRTLDDNETRRALLFTLLEEVDTSSLEGQSQKAGLHYELWREIIHYRECAADKTGAIEGSASDQAEAHRRAALELYQKIYEKIPKHDYKEKIEELESGRLPAASRSW